MLVDVVIEQRFYRCPQNHYWTDNAFPYEFWTRYLNVFTDVNIVARVKAVSNVELDWKRVDGEHVNFVNLPYYIGPTEFLKCLPEMIGVLRKRKQVHRKVIYRIPGILSAFYHFLAVNSQIKYAAEVVGDPEDVFAKGANNNMLRPVFKWLFVKMLKSQCAGACSISYVTEYSLQLRYPPNQNAFHTHYSSIQLQQIDYLKRQVYEKSESLKIICIGNLSQPYKGCDFMLRTLAQLKLQGIKCHLTWIGGGELLVEMKRLSKQLGLEQEKQVTFLGNISEREKIRNTLDTSDLFVLSSRQEGLPRVLIESMARSLVCIATDVGGVKELLPEQFIIERDNESQLVDAIKSTVDLDSDALLAVSRDNYSKALEYENSVLNTRRNEMYRHLLEVKP